MDREGFNQKLWEEAVRYLNISLIEGVSAATPYHINRMSGYLKGLMQQASIDDTKIEEVLALYKSGAIKYGRFRGKGDADEITETLKGLVSDLDYPSASITSEGLRLIMEFYGLGIDCSGYVYHILKAALAKAGGDLDQILAWPEEDQTGVNYANANLFAKSSAVIPWEDIREGDLLLIKDEESYSHVAVFVRNPETNSLYLAQSAFTTLPPGVTVTPFSLDDSHPVFGFEVTMGVSWQDYFDQGRLEAKRLIEQ